MVPFRVLIVHSEEDFLEMILVVVEDVGPQELLLCLLGDPLVQGRSALFIEPVVGGDTNYSIIGPVKVSSFKRTEKNGTKFSGEQLQSGSIAFCHVKFVNMLTVEIYCVMGIVSSTFQHTHIVTKHASFPLMLIMFCFLNKTYIHHNTSSKFEPLLISKTRRFITNKSMFTATYFTSNQSSASL